MVEQRHGNRSTNNAPRNTYRTADGNWVAVSTSAQSIAERVLRLVGHPEVIDEPWFASGHGRAEHVDLLDALRRRLDRARAPATRCSQAFDRGRRRGRPGLQRAGHRRGPAHPARRRCSLEVDDPDLGPVLSTT